MKPEFKKYLEDNDFPVDKFLVLNKHLTKMALKLEGSAVAVAEIEDPAGVEALGPGCSVVFKKFADTKGLTQAYKDYYADGEPETQQSEVTFQEKVETVRNAIKPATPAEAFEAPAPPPPVKEAPNVPEAPEPPAPPAPELDGVLDLTVFSARVAYLRNKGYKYSADAKGYVNSDGNRWVDDNVVKTLEMSEAFKKYVSQREFVQWPEVDYSKKEDPAPPVIVPREEEPAAPPVAEKPLPEKVAFEAKEITVSTPKLTLAQEAEIESKRVELLQDNDFVQNKQTYVWEKGDQRVSMSQVRDFHNPDWSGDVKLDPIVIEVVEETVVKSQEEESVTDQGTQPAVEQTAQEKAEVKQEEVVPVTEEAPKVYTEDELKEMDTDEVLAIVEKRGITIPEEGKNTNKKLRTLVLENQPAEAKEDPKPEEKPAEQPKAAEKKEEPAKALQNIVTAPEDLVSQLNIIDKVIDIAKTYQSMHYIIASFKKVLADKNFTAAEKINIILDILDANDHEING